MTIGKLFIPVIETVLPYLNAMVIVLQRLAESIAHFFGIELDGASNASALPDVFEDIEDSAEGASDAIAKSNKQLAAFDKLNNLTTSSKGSSGVEDMIDLSSQIAEAIDNYEKVWNEAFDKIDDKATRIANTISGIFVPLKDSFKEGFFSSFDLENVENMESALSDLKSAISDTFDTSIMDRINKSWKNFSSTLGKAVGAIVNVVFALQSTNFQSLADVFREYKSFNQDKLNGILDSLEKIDEYIGEITDYFSGFADLFNSPSFKGITDTLAKIGDYAIMTTIEGIVGLVKDLFGLVTKPITKNSDTIHAILQNLSDIASVLLKPLGGVVDMLKDAGITWENTWLHKLLSALTNFYSSQVGKALEKVNNRLERIKENVSYTADRWGSLKDKAIALGLKIQNSETFKKLKDDWDALKTKAIDLKVDFATKFADIKEDLKEFVNSIIRFINEHLISGINEKFNITIPKNKVTEFLGLDGWSAHIFKIQDIPTFQTGGFPEDGLFMANHGEMLGKFSNGKTAVANNYQIEAGIEEAAYRGFTRAMRGNKGSTNVNVTLQGGAEGLFKVIKEQSDEYYFNSGNEAFVH